MKKAQAALMIAFCLLALAYAAINVLSGQPRDLPGYGVLIMAVLMSVFSTVRVKALEEEVHRLKSDGRPQDAVATDEIRPRIGPDHVR